MVEKEKSQSLESERPEWLVRLCLVAKTGRGRYAKELYFGWTKEGSPRVGYSSAELSPRARESVEIFHRTGLDIRDIQSTDLTCVEYSFTGAAIDFGDVGSKKAEDLINYGIKDEKGEAKTIPLGELDVLNALVDSTYLWQSLEKGVISEVAVSAKPMYTLIVPSREEQNSALAVLFKPPNILAEESNQASFKSFVRDTLGRLLVLDESQAAGSRKGYLEAVSTFSRKKGRDKRGILSLFVNIDDEMQEGLDKAKKNVLIGSLKVARKVGLMRFEDEELPEILESLPDYDLDALDLKQLQELASVMRDVAQKSLGRY